MYEFNILWYNPSTCAPRSPPLQSNSVPQWAQCFPSPRAVVPFQLNWFSTSGFPSLLFFFHSFQREVHAFSMTSNKGQSLVWMRRVLRDWATFNRHKAQDKEHGRNKKKQGLKTVKTDPLISCFCSHLEIEQKNIHLVCTVKLFGRTHWRTEGTERQR